MIRGHVPFRTINRAGERDYDPGLQRHHLLPRQVIRHAGLAAMFECLGGQCLFFEDFRENGMLLPCAEPAAIRLGLPLHRGPHGRYTQMVIERVGQIEAEWSRRYPVDPRVACEQARMRLTLLRRALRRYLLTGSSRVRLNRFDPGWSGRDFSDLDAMADALWGATSVVCAPLQSPDTAGRSVGGQVAPSADHTADGSKSLFSLRLFACKAA